MFNKTTEILPDCHWWNMFICVDVMKLFWKPVVILTHVSEKSFT